MNQRKAIGCCKGDLPLEDDGAVSAADVVGDLGSEAFVVHEEKVNFPGVVDNEFLETVGEEMACLLEINWRLFRVHNRSMRTFLLDP